MRGKQRLIFTLTIILLSAFCVLIYIKADLSRECFMLFACCIAFFSILINFFSIYFINSLEVDQESLQESHQYKEKTEEELKSALRKKVSENQLREHSHQAILKERLTKGELESVIQEVQQIYRAKITTDNHLLARFSNIRRHLNQLRSGLSLDNGVTHQTIVVDLLQLIDDLFAS